jgi:hypothetical protein
MSAIRIGTAAADEMPRGGMQTVSWPEANQACLVMEFARLRRRLDANRPAGDDDGLDASLRELRLNLEPPAAIDKLSAIFGLSEFERQIVLLAAGIEMDSTLAAQCSEALGRERRTYASSITFSLALGTLDDPHWSALDPTAPLRRYRLIELESAQGLTSAALRIDERILHYLAGVNRLDSRMEPLLQIRPHPHWIAEEHSALADEAIQSADFDSTDAPALHLCGDDPRGQEDIAAVLAHRANRQLHILAVENLSSTNDATSPDPAQSVSQFVTLWTREAALLPAVLLVQCGAANLSASARQLIERLPLPLVIASRDPLRLNRQSQRHTVHKPSPASQRHLWANTLGVGITDGSTDSARDSTAFLGPIIDTLAEQFRLSAETICSVGTTIGASLHSSEEPASHAAERLWGACRSLSRPRLEDLAERITPAATWDDLILPEAHKETLRQLAAQARHRLTVYEDWGFAARGRRGLGISALFAGASGTGKTLAAEVLAKELQLDLFRIDLSAVVSKYIGESEKNLKQVFDAAEEGGVLLLFDEADALFGKRAEVKDSHDRYANIEVSYLLQRMESFQGIAVLTSNLKSSLDKAFQRRLRFTVDFPFPGPHEREAIWKRVFPAAAPASGLDCKRLAQLNMAGGNIRNIALNAAFLAAEAGTSIEMRHVLQATRQEAIKAERPLTDGEIRGWV